jgi:putative transcriptional regulator
MNDELFNELVASVKEGSAILRGEKEASRTFHLDRLDIKRIRERYQLTQQSPRKTQAERSPEMESAY